MSAGHGVDGLQFGMISCWGLIAEWSMSLCTLAAVRPFSPARPDHASDVAVAVAHLHFDLDNINAQAPQA